MDDIRLFFIASIIIFLLIYKIFASPLKETRWHELARKYPLTEKFNGEKLYYRTAMINEVTLNNMLTLGINSTHLYISITSILPSKNKAIYIPLKHIYARKRTDVFSDLITFTIEGVNIRFHQDLAQRLVQASNGAFSFQS